VEENQHPAENSGAVSALRRAVKGLGNSPRKGNSVLCLENGKIVDLNLNPSCSKKRERKKR